MMMMMMMMMIIIIIIIPDWEFPIGNSQLGIPSWESLLENSVEV